MALVEVTESVAAQGGRSALRAVDLDVLATIWVGGHSDFGFLSCFEFPVRLSIFKVSRFQGFKVSKLQRQQDLAPTL